MKGFAFRIYVPARDGGEHDCVGAGDTSQADECCFANSAPCAGPICGANSWPESITCPLTSESKFDLASHVLARSLPVQPKHAQTMSDAPTQSCWPYGGDSGAHWAQGRADGKLELFLYPRAHAQIQTDMQPEPCARKPLGRSVEFRRRDGCFT